MATVTVSPELVPEKSTWRYAGVLKDEAGAVVPAAALTTLTLTLYALDANLTVINTVSAVNILNTGRGTVDASGNLVITFTPADNAVLDATLDEETHVALIEWTWSAGAKAGRHNVIFRVKNLQKVA